MFEQEVNMDLYVKLLDDEGHASVVEKMRAIHEKAVLEGQLLRELHAQEEAIKLAANEIRSKPIMRNAAGSNVIEDY